MNKKVQLFLGDIKEEEIYYHDMDNLEENNAKMSILSFLIIIFLYKKKKK